MKAVRIHQFGDPEVIQVEDIPVPQPAEDEVLVRVHASAINPLDQKIFSGQAQKNFPTAFPLTLGWDLSGTVTATGMNVTQFKIGEEVYGRPFPAGNGAFAEYIVVKAGQLALKPASIDHLQAAAIPLSGLTAWQGLFTHGKLEAGQRVLIHAASGGVGSFAVQYARWKGAYVIATGSFESLDLIKKLGADEVIDYKYERFEDRVQGVDLVLDLIGKDTQLRSLQVIKPGGRLITTVAPEHASEAEARQIYLEGYTAQSEPDDLRQIAALVDQGTVRPVIARVMNLEEVKQAEILQSRGGIQGKIVIKVAL